jgi:SAM-dependent methyltransferase
MTPHARPPAWNEHNASAFQLADVVDNYHLRPPYPSTLAPFLLDLVPPRSGAVLELGCGTGEIARALAGHVDRIDAVDISARMLARARTMPGGDRANIRWIEGQTEDAPLNGPYALAVAGAALHWMDWDVVLPRIAQQLAPDAVLAIVVIKDTRQPWGDDLDHLSSRYSAIQNWERAHLIALIEARKLFELTGEQQLPAEPYERTIDDYIDGQHSTSGLARDRMTIDHAREFDRELRRLLAPHATSNTLHLSAGAEIKWGKPLTANR